jgi:hypothetical protein
VTYSDTDAIYNNIGVSSLSVDEIYTINNIKHGWKFILLNIEYETNFALICQTNKIIGTGLFDRGGFTRNLPVSIGGTEWKPEMPVESQIKEEVHDLLLSFKKTELAILLMLYLMRRQVFIDGNKRTAMLIANHVMIRNGCEIISIPIERQAEFVTKLLSFYETNKYSPIINFVYEYCIDDLDLK